MWVFRWKWIMHHFLASLAALIISGSAFLTLFPAYLARPLKTAEIIAALAGATALSLVIAVITGYHSSKSIRRQLEEISLGAKNLAYGNLDYRLSYSGNVEVDSIIAAFNEMAERLSSQVNALQSLAEENEQLLKEAKITAVSEERQRLARDLHDAVSQQLFAISMMAATALKVAEDDGAKAAALMGEIAHSAHQAQSEMRALLLQLRPLTLQEESIAEALMSLAAELEGKQGLKCVLKTEQVNLSKNMENQLFRIAQEALSNILRHAEAKKVTISLMMSENGRRVFLIIEDDGQGFDPAKIPPTSFGIRSIRERATLLGGTAQWITVPGRGTKVEIRVPILSEAGLEGAVQDGED